MTRFNNPKATEYEVQLNRVTPSLTEHVHDSTDDEVDDEFFEELRREITFEFTLRINRGRLELRPRAGGKWRDAERELEGRVGTLALAPALAWLKAAA